MVRDHGEQQPMSRRVQRGFSPDALRQARLTQGLSRGELARLSGVSLSAVQFWETGRSRPQVDSLARVTETLGVAMSDLVQVEPGERFLADLRILAGLTQHQLAQQLGVSTATISNLELGYTKLPDRLIAPLAQALNTRPNEVSDAYQRGRTRPRES